MRLESVEISGDMTRSRAERLKRRIIVWQGRPRMQLWSPKRREVGARALGGYRWSPPALRMAAVVSPA